MKPKNRVYCLEASRMKMLFETEKRAYRFIEFNGEELLKNRPEGTELRAYKCEACGGWHITSAKPSEFYDNMVENVVKSYREWANTNRTNVDVALSVDSLANKLWNDAISCGACEKASLKTFLNNRFAEMGTRQAEADKIRHILNERVKNLT